MRSALTLEAFEATLRRRAPAARRGKTSASTTTPKRRRRSPRASPTRPARRSPRRPGDARPGLASASSPTAPPRDAPPRRAASRAAPTRPRRSRSRTTARSARSCCTARSTGPALTSNWELVNTAHSTNGHSIAVMGPQVGYYNPQILMEEDLHGPGIDARGAAFPGVNLYVELGHGRDYAWSATTATADNVDTFAEVLCQDEFHYLYKGQCVPMEKLERTNTWTPNGDRTGNAARLGNADRLPHRARHRLRARHGRRQRRSRSRARARPTSTRPTRRSASPSSTNRASSPGPQQFQQAASNINFAASTGPTSTPTTSPTTCPAGCPQRAPKTSPDFPILGTGEYDWQGYRPAAAHDDTCSRSSQHPQRDRPAVPRLLEQQAGAALRRRPTTSTRSARSTACS